MEQNSDMTDQMNMNELPEQENELLLKQLWVAGLNGLIVPTRMVDYLQNEQIDLDKAFNLVQHFVLNNGQVSLADLSTLMLGLSKLVSDKSQILNDNMNLEQKNILETFGFISESSLSQKSNNNDSSLDDNNRLVGEQFIATNIKECLKSNKKRRLKFDEKTQLTETVRPEEEEEDEMTKRAKVVPCFGLSRTQQRRLRPEIGSNRQMQKPVRMLSPKLMYLFTQHTMNNKNKNNNRHLCDHSNRSSVYFDETWHKEQYLNFNMPCSNQSSSMSYDNDDDDYDDNINDNNCVMVDRSMDWLFVTNSSHYLPVSCGHLFISPIQTTNADVNTTQANNNKNNYKVVDLYDTRATTSIKSITYSHQLSSVERSTHHCNIFSWQEEHQQNRNSTNVMMMMTPRLQPLQSFITSSCGVHPFEVEHLIRVVMSRGGSTMPTITVTRPLIALYFAQLLELADQGFIQVSQSSMTCVDDFTNVPKVYFSIIKQ